MSRVQALPSSVHAVPFVLKASVGQEVLVPVQLSATSHSPAAARHIVPAFPAGCWQVALVPLQVAVVQTLPSSVQAVPVALKASVGQAVLVPVQVSTTSHSPATARHTAPAFPAGCWQVTLEPSHCSRVQGLVSAVQEVPADFLASVGQAVVTPSQVSARSHSPAAARQTVPAALMASAGQVALVPVQFSAASHRSTAARQTVLDDRKASVGQLVLVPVQVSAASQGPAAARHTVPAFPAGCVQVALVPLQMSRVHTLASSVQTVPFTLKASVGHAVLVPVQVSATSHSPAAARHTVPAFPAGCVQVVVLASHRSTVHGLVSSVPAVLMASAGQAVLVPVQVSAMSHPPTAARHTVPAFPAACVHVGAPTVPLHTSAVHTLPSSVQLVPAAFTVSGGQLALWGASAMSWPMLAVFPVDAFAPLAPAAACATSALSEAALVELDVSAWNRSVMPVGAPMAEPPARPKQATSMVLATVVVIDGVELLTCPPDALMGLVVSTLEYALIPPDTRADETG